MEKNHRSNMYLGFMVFNVLLLFLCFNSCWQINPEFENHLLINNSTQDTLFFKDFKRYIDDYPFYEIDLFSGLNIISKHDKKSPFEMIQEAWKYRGDTIEIYRKGFETIKWAGPLREMPDSIHHFFNKNSWEFSMGGYKNKWERATFTITEDDFKQ